MSYSKTPISVKILTPASHSSEGFWDCSDLNTLISDSLTSTHYLSGASGRTNAGIASGESYESEETPLQLEQERLGSDDGESVDTLRGGDEEENHINQLRSSSRVIRHPPGIIKKGRMASSEEQNATTTHSNLDAKLITLQPPTNLEKAPSYSHNLYLFSEEDDSQPPASATHPHQSTQLLPNIIHSLANYASSIQPTPGAANGVEGGGPPAAKSANMGTFIGVFLPCIQNIFGVILFIRLTWVVGTAGVLLGFTIVFMCCCVTMLTAISMSAIATNGVVPGGGSYFMISRSLGPEFGGAVGILFYIGTTLAAAMYIVGAVEILITYMAPFISIFGDTNVPENMYNNYRVYGTGLLCCIGLVVYVGVAFVNKFASVALACVIFSILAVYIGIFVNVGGNDKLQMCLLGQRLLLQVNNCTKEPRGELWRIFCTGDDIYTCDPYFQHNELTVQNGIKGLSSGVLYDNLLPSFRSKGDLLTGPAEEEQMNGGDSGETYNQVVIDITTSFTILVGIFFPSVTGIMAGSNRSGDLADAQKSIPIGTICAILTTSTVYLSTVILFGGTVDNYLLRDKFGQSIGGRLVVANIAWPNEWVILIGSFLSTIGAGLQSLTGAPRLLQAIARDNIIPFLQPFQVSSAKGEPTRALLLTLCICECGVLLGNVDYLAPLLSMFFLMCYGFVNLACALQTLLKTPNWRPRFRFYHWIGSSIGLGLCITVMFMTSWYYALLAMGIAGVIYKYIEYRGAEKEWGDGITGLALSAARYALLRLAESPQHTKNWRPQILILSKPNDEGQPTEKKLFTFAGQLKAGKGLTMAGAVLEGSWYRESGRAGAIRKLLGRVLEEEKIKGFGECIVAPEVEVGVACLIQSAGLGGLKPNTVLIGWPNSWREKGTSPTFLHFLRSIVTAKMALLVPKGLVYYPDSGDRVAGYIDVWWIVHDGGLLMLLPFLLKQHRTWKSCKMRIFTVAQLEDNSIQMKKDLKAFLYALRIDAEVEIVEMSTSDITAYTYERTLLMEQRSTMLRELNLNKRRRMSLVDEVVAPSVVPPPLLQTGSSLDGDIDDMDLELEEGEGGVEKVLGKVHFEDDDKRAAAAAAQLLDEPEQVSNSSRSQEKSTPEKKGYEDGGQGQQRPDEDNVRRMHTAVKLNEVIQAKSSDAKLVIINLPTPPTRDSKQRESNYLEFLEVLTEGLDRVLLVRGSGREVITIYS